MAGVTGDLRERLAREITPVLYREIRELWKAHSIAEDKRDIAGLIATLTPDCVYEVVGESGARWEGHVGATQFYLTLLGAIPDIHFDLQQIVIGPQGVCEEAKVTGTQQGPWLSHAATGERVEFRVVIFFPWDSARKKFTGERVFVFMEDA
ncbi:MAG TPA: nuclear transport factor 2 family protein [Gemmatimonadales bacterium]|nr:nuclear transport factor 2 family protein [Gemmatimonadales bacterium]